MHWRSIARDWGIALLAGYVATKLTDRAQTALWRATPAQERAKEPAVDEPSSARSAAQLLCEWCGITPTETRVRRLKRWIHYGLGLGWGSVYGLSRRRGDLSPLLGGVITGTSLSLVVDEALNPVLGITPPPRAYPPSAHARGLLTHLVYGLAVAATAETLYRSTDRLHPWRCG